MSVRVVVLLLTGSADPTPPDAAPDPAAEPFAAAAFSVAPRLS